MSDLDTYYENERNKKRGLSPVALTIDILTSYEEMVAKGHLKCPLCLKINGEDKLIVVDVKITETVLEKGFYK